MSAFYLMPFRIYELIIGGMVAYHYQQPSIRVGKLCSYAGFAIITFIIFFSSHVVDYQVIIDHLLPCVATALLLYGGYYFSILKNQALVHLGKISYSLYLVHFPIIAFYQYLGVVNIDIFTAGLMLTLFYCLALALYYWIEKPARHLKDSRKTGKMMMVGGVIISALLSFASLTSIQNGMAWRLPDNAQENLPIFEKDFGMGDFDYRIKNIIGAKGVKPSFIIVGDSYAAQYFYGFDELLKQHNMAAIGYSIQACFFVDGYGALDDGKIVEKCDNSYQAMLKIAENNNLPVIVAFSWLSYDQTLLDHNKKLVLFTKKQREHFILNQLAKYKTELGEKRKMVIIGASPDLTSNDLLSRCLLMPSFFGEPCPINMKIERSEFNDYDQFNMLLKHFAHNNNNIYFLDPIEVFCDSEECIMMQQNKRYFFDSWHLSRLGSKFAVQHFSEKLFSIISK